MATCFFYGSAMLGLSLVYLGLRFVLGNRDSVWARYSEAMRQRGQIVSRTPEWDRRVKNLGLVLAIGMGGGLLVLALLNYLMYF